MLLEHVACGILQPQNRGGCDDVCTTSYQPHRQVVACGGVSTCDFKLEPILWSVYDCVPKTFALEGVEERWERS